MEPTNRELKIMFDNLSKDLEEKHQEFREILTEIKVDVKETKAQTTLTNGKVAKLYWWKNGLFWAMSAAWTLILLGIPVAFMILRYVVLNEIKSSVDTSIRPISDKVSSVEETLFKYDISIEK